MVITSVLSASGDISLADGALYSVIGLIIVIAVLALLVGIFYLTGYLFQTKALSRENLFERKSKTSPQTDSRSDGDEADDEITAAIVAAVGIILQNECGDDVKPDFVIRRIKRDK